jgi:hypothetical protein
LEPASARPTPRGPPSSSITALKTQSFGPSFASHNQRFLSLMISIERMRQRYFISIGGQRRRTSFRVGLERAALLSKLGLGRISRFRSRATRLWLSPA